MNHPRGIGWRRLRHLVTSLRVAESSSDKREKHRFLAKTFVLKSLLPRDLSVSGMGEWKGLWVLSFDLRAFNSAAGSRFTISSQLEIRRYKPDRLLESIGKDTKSVKPVCNQLSGLIGWVCFSLLTGLVYFSPPGIEPFFDDAFIAAARRVVKELAV